MQTHPWHSHNLHVARKLSFWLALGLLLFNDHWLKLHAPSWFSGKLSDCTGLFIVAPVTLWFLAWFVPQPKQSNCLALAVFVALGVLFVWFKAVPAGNAWINQWVKVTLDPSDLLALPLLGVSAWQWLQPTGFRQTHLPRLHWAYVLAGVACLATAPEPPPPAIEHLGVYENTVFAEVYNSEVYAPSNRLEYIGNGRWIFADATLPSTSTQAQMCRVNHPNICYRLNDPAQTVEYSTDEGATWQVVWRERRQEFVQRYDNLPILGRQFVWVTYPFLPTSINRTVYNRLHLTQLAIHENSEIEYEVLVSLYDNGLLYRNTAGTWQVESMIVETAEGEVVLLSRKPRVFNEGCYYS
jgi:hypothetical protein